MNEIVSVFLNRVNIVVKFQQKCIKQFSQDICLLSQLMHGQVGFPNPTLQKSITD
jgi:hypothetical protein